MDECAVYEQAYKNGYEKGYRDGKERAMESIMFPRLLVRSPEPSKEELEALLLSPPIIYKSKEEIIPLFPLRWIPVGERLPESQNPVLVVAVSKGMGFSHIFKAAHINHHEITEDEYGWTDGEYDSEYDEENDCFWIPECWYECNAVEGNTNWIMDEDYTITHWMPLPQPPAEM